jgi:hypothetical protein
MRIGDLPFPLAALVGLVAASLQLLITIRPAHGLMTTEELGAICGSALENPVRDNPKFAFCTALGILMTDALEKDLICVPKELDTTAALRVFVERAKRESHKDIEGLVTMYRAFLEAYPCKK